MNLAKMVCGLEFKKKKKTVGTFFNFYQYVFEVENPSGVLPWNAQ